jgi:hypothetical protein
MQDSAALDGDKLAREFKECAAAVNYIAAAALGERDINFVDTFRPRQTDTAYMRFTSGLPPNNATDTIELLNPTISDVAFTQIAILPSTGQVTPSGNSPGAFLLHVRMRADNGGTRQIAHPTIADDTRKVIIRPDSQATNANINQGIHLFNPGSTAYYAVPADAWLEAVVKVRNVGNTIQLRIGSNAMGTGGGGVADIKVEIMLLGVLQ